MPYVRRNLGGNVTQVAQVLQPGRAEEFLAANDPEVLAFLHPPPPPKTAAPLTAEELAEILIDNPAGPLTAGLVTAKKAARP